MTTAIQETPTPDFALDKEYKWSFYNTTTYAVALKVFGGIYLEIPAKTKIQVTRSEELKKTFTLIKYLEGPFSGAAWRPAVYPPDATGGAYRIVAIPFLPDGWPLKWIEFPTLYRA